MIVDIFDNVVNKNNLPIIKIKMKMPNVYSKKIDNEIKNSIWDIDDMYLDMIFKKFKLNKSKYKKLSHYWYPEPKCNHYISILFGNIKSDIFAYPSDFVKVCTYGKGYLWKPICSSTYTYLGLIYGITKPQIKDYCVMLSSFIIDYHGEYEIIKNVTNLNEFYCVGLINMQRKTILRSLFLKKNKIFYLKDINNNYVNVSGNNILITDGKKKNKIIFTKKGELVINNKCIEGTNIDNNINNGLILKECNNNISQKWFPQKSTIRDYNICSQHNFLCMSADKNNDVKLGNMNKETREHVFEIEDLVNMNDYEIIESNNPWYINKNIKHPQYIKKRKELNTGDNMMEYTNNKTYARTPPQKNTHTDMRFTYNNFTKCKKCIPPADMKKKQIEQFSGRQILYDERINMIIYIFVVMVILMFIYRR